VSNSSFAIYPHWNSVQIRLPNATRNEALTDNGESPDNFLGWFTKPQPSDGGSGDGGTYIGQAGDIVSVSTDMVLYPWFNVAPTIVHSSVQDGFYEDQSISYDQLLTLIDAKDTDDPSPNASNMVIEWGGVTAWKDIYSLNIDTLLNKAFPTMSSAQKAAIKQTVNYSDFTPVIADITYECDGKDSANKYYSDRTKRTQNMTSVKSSGLLTDSTHVGSVVIHYQITDNGTLSNSVLLEDSPITVDFYLHTQVSYNEAPELSLQGTYIYTCDDSITSDSITAFLIGKQETYDSEDFDNSHRPWWSTVADSTAFNDRTHSKLYDSIEIVSVYDITFNSGYEHENADRCSEIKKITDIKELFELKDNGDEAFDYITNFKVEFDVHDQWNKYASASHLGMNRTERSIEVIMFNNKDDYDLASAAISDNMRYISSEFTNTLGDSYWGSMSYGGKLLANTFERYVYNSAIKPISYSGFVSDSVSSGRLAVTVNDYSY
jgi:hypothetical protein